jgi:hypothetical protein
MAAALALVFLKFFNNKDIRGADGCFAIGFSARLRQRTLRKTLRPHKSGDPPCGKHDHEREDRNLAPSNPGPPAFKR